jgi:hypothetical protein
LSDGGLYHFAVEGSKEFAAMTDKEAGKVADGLIQSYVGPDQKIADMRGFHWALVYALKNAHSQGWKDRMEAESLVKH